MRSRMLQSLLLLGLAFVASLTASALYPALFRTQRGIVSVATWPSIWATAAAKVAAWTSKPWLAALAVLAALALITVLTLRQANATRRGLLAAGIVLGAGVTVFCFMGTLAHASKGGFPERYGIMPMILLQEGLLLQLALSLSDRMAAPARRILDIAGLSLLITSVAFAYGPPSPARMQQGLDQAVGQRTEEVIREGCTHVIGNYWTVWPTVFHANAALYRLGSKHRVWGITIRSEITQDQWLRPAMQGTARFAVGLGPQDAKEASFFRAHYKLPPLVLKGTLNTISVFVPLKPDPSGGG